MQVAGSCHCLVVRHAEGMCMCTCLCPGDACYKQQEASPARQLSSARPRPTLASPHLQVGGCGAGG